jgi:formylglycine-generating enzyme required for sulfatase activity
MVYVQGGNFYMGSNDGGGDEQPVHQVRVSSFYIGKYEVTQAQWREVMGGNPSFFKGDDLPVEQVTWYDAVDFCNRLSRMEGLTPSRYL